MLRLSSIRCGIQRALLEPLLTLLAVLCLAGLALPLAAADMAAGLHGRYEVSFDRPQSDADRAGTASQRQRAQRLQTQAGHDIAWLAATGWLVLWLGRRRIPRSAFAAMAAAAWLYCAAQIQAFGWDWHYARHGTVALLLLALPAGRVAPRPSSGQVRSQCWLYPGWVLLTGLGLLWLLDYAARGYPEHLFLGLKHADGLFMAYATVAVVAGFAPGIVSLLMRALAHLDSAALRASSTAKATAMLLGIGWALAIALAVNEGNRLTAVVAEMLRVPVWLLLAWTCYRWVDTANKPARMLLGVFGLTALLMLGLAFNHGDKGQMLLFSLAAVFLAAGWAGHQGGALGLRGATLLGILLAIAGVAGIVWLLFNVVPQWSETGAWRVAAVSAPFSTRLVFLDRQRQPARHGAIYRPGTQSTGGMTMSRPVYCVQRLAFLILALASIFAVLIPWYGTEALRNPAPRRHLDESQAEAAQAWTASVVALAPLLPEQPHPPARHPCGHDPQDRKLLDDRLDIIDRALAGLAPTQNGGNSFLAAHYRTDRQQLFEDSEIRRIDCNSLLRTTQWLGRNAGAALSSLTWRERHPGRWPADDFTQVAVDPARFARPNPWRSLPGCIYLGKEAARYWPQANGGSLCGQSGQRLAADVRATPRDAAVLRSALERRTAQPAAAGNSVAVLGRRIPQGAHLWFTLEPEFQAPAQLIVACYTGDPTACRDMGVAADQWHDRYEAAAVRMAGLIQVDIASGAIEVLASGHTPCFAQDHDGPGRAPHCPPLPREPAYRPHQLANHALHGAAMEGSLDKPILALGLLRSDLGTHLRSGAGRQALQKDFMTSNSAAFLDRLFAKDRNFVDAGRLAHVARAARDLGWNQACSQPGGSQCGNQEVLYGRMAAAGGGLPVVGGRLLMEPTPGATGWRPMTHGYPAAWARRCSAREWKQCSGGGAVDLASEAWGQGHSLASPLGVATMLARLGAAANGARQAVPPHLIGRLAHPGQAPLALPAAPQTLPINADDARLILAGMALTHTAGGTVHAACLAVFGSASRCNRITALAGKTGTPRFHHNGLTLEERRRECARLQALAASGANDKAALADCAMAPYKWYAALVRADARPDASWSKAIVVLVERNYYRSTGLVDSPKDFGPNVAAEIALRYLAQAYPQLFPASG